MPTNAGRRLAQLSKRLGEIDRVIVTTAGQIVHDTMIEELSRDTGGDRALSGFAGGRYKLDLQINPIPRGVRISPVARQTGMWTILDSGRRGGYDVAARPRRKRKTKGKTAKTSSRGQAMNIGGQWHAGPYTVKRSWAGRGTWRRGKARALPLAVDAARDELHRAVIGG